MNTRDLTVARMILIAICVCCLHAVQAQPTIASNNLLVVGEEETLSCAFTTTETVSSSPLTWTRGSSPLVASTSQTIDGPGGTKVYNIAYTFTVSPSDHNVVLTCTATFPSGTTTATKTLSVNKGPDPAVVSGPSSVVSGVTSTWTCEVDGASHSAPTVHWEFGNRTRLPSKTFSEEVEVYRDSNNLEIFKQTSVLKLTLSTGAPNFTLACKAVHFDTNKAVVSSLAVTVSPGPVTFLTSTSPQDESSTVIADQLTGLTSSSPQAGTLAVTAGPVTGRPRSPQDDTSEVTEPGGKPDDNSTAPGDTESTSSNALAIGLGVAGAVFVVLAAVGVCCVWKRRSEGQHKANPDNAPAAIVPPANISLANSSPPHALQVSGGAGPSTDKTAHDSPNSDLDDSSVADSDASVDTQDSSEASEASDV